VKLKLLSFATVTVLSLGHLGADSAAPPAPAPAVAQNAVPQEASGGAKLGLPRWLTVGGEIRGRTEFNTGVSFTERDSSFHLQRARLDLGIRLHRQVRFTAEFQDSRAFGWDTSPAPPASVADSADLRLANLQIGDAGEGPLELVAGRQALIFGSKRLISTSSWSNVGPAFDGVRLTQHWGALRVHYFAATRVRSLGDGFDHFSSATKSFGTYASWQSGDGHTVVEPYWLANTFSGRVSESGVRGGEEAHTFGTRLVRQGEAGMGYEVEIVSQQGEIAGDGLSAWGAHANVGRRFADWRGTPRFFVDYSFASGDGNRSDGRQHTLQQLFPTHKWGTADDLAWRNIHEPLMGVEAEPRRKWRTTLRFRELFVASRQDGLYGFSGAELVRNPAATSSHIGHELDLQINYRFSSRLDILGGYGHVFQGTYLRQSMPEHAVNVAFLMWTYKL
jgi:hypothetical protein